VARDFRSSTVSFVGSNEDVMSLRTFITGMPLAGDAGTPHIMNSSDT
jgi:hypothetical protein